MKCPKCGNKVFVVDTVNDNELNVIYRRKRCTDCGCIFHTVEKEIEYTDDFAKLWRKNWRK